MGNLQDLGCILAHYRNSIEEHLWLSKRRSRNIRNTKRAMRCLPKKLLPELEEHQQVLGKEQDQVENLTIRNTRNRKDTKKIKIARRRRKKRRKSSRNIVPNILEFPLSQTLPILIHLARCHYSETTLRK